MALRIRPAQAADAIAASRLMVRAIRHNNAADYPAVVIERLLQRHTCPAVAEMIATRQVFVACEDDRIVGTAALEEAILRGLFVAIDQQGRGIARFLVAHIEDVARARGLIDLELQSSTTAHRFYERLGYRTQAFRFDLEGSTYRMTKRIVDS